MSSIDVNGTYTAGILKENIALYPTDPTRIIRDILRQASEASSGVANFVDPTNPAVHLLEAACVLHAGFIDENRALVRAQYPQLALTEADVYNHASPSDFLDRFAQPADAYFSVLVNKNDLLTKMVDCPSINGKRVTIARNTEVTIGTTTFALQYPINIDQLEHGDIQISYDASTVSPLQTLDNNILYYVTKTDQKDYQEWLYFQILMTQFTVVSNEFTVTASQNFSKTLTLSDSFYYARVFMKTGSATSWTELVTTHSQMVYDLSVPTATLKVADGTLTVSVPQIYITQAMVSGSLRVDVYLTKGAIDLSLDNFSVDAFQVSYRTIDKNDSSVYTAAMKNINARFYTTGTVTGGTAQMSISDFRNLIVNNATGQRLVPITPSQIAETLSLSGYEITKNVDYITDRIFLASRPLPAPSNLKNLLTAGSATMATLSASIGALSSTGIYQVAVNTDQITLKPESVYRISNGIVQVLTNAELASIQSLSPQDRASYVNSDNLYYSPFHYVLDMSGDEFQSRPYYLNKPQAKNIRFISYNETTGYTINAQTYAITKNANGYTFSVTTKANAAFAALPDSEVFAQLSFIPPNDSARCFIRASSITLDSNGNRVFSFSLLTNYQIDSLHRILFLALRANATDVISAYCALDATFDIVYGTNAVRSSIWVSSDTDNYLNTSIENPGAYAVTRESVNLVFGNALTTLWSRSRSVVNATNYSTYTSPVYQTYSEDVYSGDRVSVVGGSVVYATPVHRAGDTVLDSVTGQPVVLHAVGDPILDENGDPIALPRAIDRLIDILMIEASYLFATDASSVSYRQTIPDTLNTWVSSDLVDISKQLLEKTRVFFYPKKTAGLVSVSVQDGSVVQIQASQSFSVVLSVSKTVAQDTTLKEALTAITITTIADYLSRSTVTISEITSALRVKYAGDVVGVRITPIAGVYETVTVVNNHERLGVRKNLEALADQTLAVVEDIDVQFISLG